MEVLLGIGGSEDSLTALQRVVQRVTETGDNLTIALLENPESSLTIEALANRVSQTVSDQGLSLDETNGVEIRRLDGDPGPALVELAEREGFDRIALGGGQRSPMGKIVVGDIAEFVLVNANTTVLLIR